MKIKYVVSALLLGTSAIASASVTLNFNNAFAGGVSSNFSNAAGTPTDGLFWGIIVDNTGDGVLSSYGSVVPQIDTQVSLTTSMGGATDDTLIFSADLTMDTSGLTEGDFVTTGDTGGLSGITGLDLTSEIATGNDFYIVWFDNVDSTKAGVFGDATFVLPPDTSLTDYDVPFEGVDPSRAASGVVFQTVPEPSSFALLGLGGLGFLLRRRR